MRVFYAYVLTREWGEPDRETKIGPFTPVDPDASTDEQIDALRENLEARGETINYIEAVEA